jgi:nucleoside-diphosphate-sugar epimerase
MNCVVVLGASGYIGKSLIDQLVLNGFFVRGLSRVPPLIPEHWKNKYEHHSVDFQTSKSTLCALISGASCAIHCAGHYDAEPDVLEQYISSVRNMAAASKKTSVNHFILISTLAVYGAGVEGTYAVDSKLNPSTAYGMSRFRAESALSEIFSHSKVAVSVIRIPAVVGVGMKSIVLSGLFRMINTGFFFHPGGHNSSLACIGIKKLARIMANLVSSRPSSGIKIIQPVDNLKWVDLVAEYGSIANKRIVRIPFPGRVLVRILKVFALEAPRPLLALSSEAIFKSNADELPQIGSINESMDDIREIIKVVKN